MEGSGWGLLVSGESGRGLWASGGTWTGFIVKVRGSGRGLSVSGDKWTGFISKWRDVDGVYW